MKGKVYFIGAGPGDPDLLTIKAKDILEKSDVIIYAGSLVPEDLVLKFAKKGAKIINSASLTLDKTHSIIKDSVDRGLLVSRVHTGEPSIYGAIHEQIYLLNRDNIDYEIIPGISASFLTAAKAKVSFTIPKVSQSLIITRVEGKTKVPEREKFEQLASHRCAMAVYLSATKTEEIVSSCLRAGYNGDTTVVIGHKVGWKDEKIIFTTLRKLSETVSRYSLKRQTIFLILPHREHLFFSKLYDPDFSHGFRK